MSVITFWSNDNIETGQTTTMAAIATYLSIEHNYKILVINSAYNDKTLEDAFWDQTKKIKINMGSKKTDIGTGISGLLKILPNKKDSPEVITNYTKIIFKDRLELLTDNDIEYKDYVENREQLAEITKLASHYYDMVFIDLKGDFEDKITKEILNMSTVVVVNLTQRLRQINECVKFIEDNEEIITKEKRIFVLGKYNPRLAKYTCKNIMRYIKEKQLSFVPFNNLLFEVGNEGKMADFFIKFRKVDENSANGQFILSIQLIAERIMRKIKESQMRV